jgi:hypothetical protein
MALVMEGYTAPALFPQVGGAKPFRDGIWSKMRFPFYADRRDGQTIPKDNWEHWLLIKYLLTAPAFAYIISVDVQ